MHPVQIAKAYGHLQQFGLDRLSDGEVLEQYYLANVGHLLSDERCGHPDKPDAEIAEKTSDAELEQLSKQLSMPYEEACCLQRAHAAMLAATGRGSWQAGCHTDLYPHKDRHAVTYFLRENSFNENWTRTASDSELRHLLSAGVWGPEEQGMDLFAGKSCLEIIPWFLEESYRRVNVKLIRVDQESKANIVALGRYIAGGTIGLGWFPPSGNNCRSQVQSHYDTSWRAPLYNQVRLFLHEFGHNHLLYHEFSAYGRRSKSIMSYENPGNCWGFYREGTISPDPLLSDASLPELREFFGDGQIPIGDQPPPGDVQLVLTPDQPLQGFFTPFRGYVPLPDGRIAFIEGDESGQRIRHIG